MKYRHFLTLVYLLITISSMAQGDSLHILSFENFLSKVREHHPMARIASIQAETGQAQLQYARGGFDPKAFVKTGEKYFDGKQYYSLNQGGFKIPTWFGMELLAAYENNDGLFLNPENNTPNAGLYYAGVSLPLGKGLFIDQRRAELRKAQVYTEISELEKRLMLNDLFYEAGKAYWEWFSAYYQTLIYREALQLSQTRLEAVKQSVMLGDRPAMDTLENGIQVQNRKLSLQQAELERKNAKTKLSIYLWDEGFIPLEPAKGTIPEDLNITMANQDNNFGDLDSLTDLHPELNQYRAKSKSLEIERRWKIEQLKPQLNLKYNALNAPVNDNPFAGYSINNYTWGLEFSMPLFLRKERGGLNLTKLKLEQTQLMINNKLASLKFKIQAAINEWETLNDQIKLYQGTVSDYQKLLNGERQLFQAGESSVFMVNSRELGYINARIKLIDLLGKQQKASLGIDYALGRLQ